MLGWNHRRGTVMQTVFLPMVVVTQGRHGQKVTGMGAVRDPPAESTENPPRASLSTGNIIIHPLLGAKTKTRMMIIQVTVIIIIVIIMNMIMIIVVAIEAAVTVAIVHLDIMMKRGRQMMKVIELATKLSEKVQNVWKRGRKMMVIDRAASHLGRPVR